MNKTQSCTLPSQLAGLREVLCSCIQLVVMEIEKCIVAVPASLCCLFSALQNQCDELNIKTSHKCVAFQVGNCWLLPSHLASCHIYWKINLILLQTWENLLALDVVMQRFQTFYYRLEKIHVFLVTNVSLTFFFFGHFFFFFKNKSWRM